MAKKTTVKVDPVTALKAEIKKEARKDIASVQLQLKGMVKRGLKSDYERITATRLALKELHSKTKK